MEMLFESGIQFVTGPQGGTFALGALVGWVLCANSLLKDANKRIDKLETELRDVRTSLNEQLNELRGKYEEELRTPSVPAHMLPTGHVQ